MLDHMSHKQVISKRDSIVQSRCRWSSPWISVSEFLNTKQQQLLKFKSCSEFFLAGKLKKKLLFILFFHPSCETFVSRMKKTAVAGRWKCFLVLSALATIQSAHLYRNAAFIHLVTCQNCCLNKAKCYYYLSPSRLATRHFCPFTDYVFY